MTDADSVDRDELHEHTSRYLAMAKAGKRVTVTENGEPIAYLSPVGDRARTPAPHLDPADTGSGSAFQRLVAAGHVHPAKGRGLRGLLDDIPRPDPDEGSVFEELMRMREEERY